MNKTITIGRQFGSGGRELGKRLAEKLGYAYYDSEIISQISQKTDLAESYVKQILEHNPVANYPITIGRTFYSQPSAAVMQANTVYAEQSNIITEMADKSDCIIVGRCADYILKDRHPLRVFVYADKASRMARCREKGHETLTDMQLWRKIRTVDRHRAKYYSFYTGLSWGDKFNYDLCINTTNAQIKDIVEALTRLVASR